MAAHGGLWHLENGAELRDRQLLAFEEHEHATARRVGQRRHVVQNGCDHISVNPDTRLHYAHSFSQHENGPHFGPGSTIIKAMKRISIQALKSRLEDRETVAKLEIDRSLAVLVLVDCRAELYDSFINRFLSVLSGKYYILCSFTQEQKLFR